MFVTCPRCSQQNHPTATQCAFCGASLPASQAGLSPGGFPSTGAPGFSGGGTGGGPGQPGGPATSQPQVGQLIDGKYRVERILGEGGMGVVYVALDINADQRVVIKSIRPEYANRGDFRERTLAEGKALAKIDHQNVVRFNSIVNVEETGELYIIMQFIEGESLDRTLEKANAAGQKLPIIEVLRVFKQILDGVGAAHSEGLIHRDLKPANVLVRAKDGVAKVMDFGIAKTEGATRGPTIAGGIVGSLWYMAPEQIQGARGLDKRLDIYALGIVLYELTTGVVPFDGDTEYEIMTKHMGQPVPSVRALRPDAPPWIDEVIAGATQKDRDLRFGSCEEFRAMIDRYDGGIQVPRSATDYEHIAFPAQVAARAATGVGGAGVSGAGGPTPSSGQFSESASGSTGSGRRRSGPGAVGRVLVGLLVVGGAIGGYLAYAANDGRKSATNSGATKDDEDTGTRGASDRDSGIAVAGRDKNAKKKEPIDALVGTWKVDGSGRILKAVRVGNEVEFRVAKEAEWDGAYFTDEVRFKLLDDGDGSDKTFTAVDRYRPPPGKMKYSKSALASCLLETSTVAGKLLEGHLKGDDVLEVNLAKAAIPLEGAPGDPTTISGCAPGKTEGTAKATVRRQKE